MSDPVRVTVETVLRVALETVLRNLQSLIAAYPHGIKPSYLAGTVEISKEALDAPPHDERAAREYNLLRRQTGILADVIMSRFPGEIGRLGLSEGAVEIATRLLESPIADVLAERVAQDAKHGGPEHDDTHTSIEWCEMIGQKLGIAELVTSDPEESMLEYRRRLVQVAALAVAAIESFDRKAEAELRSEIERREEEVSRVDERDGMTRAERIDSEREAAADEREHNDREEGRDA